MNSTKPDILNQSIQFLKSVGPKRTEAFKKIGIVTIYDLLQYFPSKHLDRTTTLTAAKAYGYVMNGFAGELTVIGKVVDKEKRRFGKKEILKIQMRDASGYFECVWFQGVKYFQDVFKEGDIYAVSAKPTISKYSGLQFTHPDYDRITEEESQNFLNTGKIIPFYRIPKELRSGNLGDLSMRKILSNAVEQYADHISESLPPEIISEYNLLSLKEAIKNYHFPESLGKLTDAKHRLKFEELFFIEILVALRKYNYKTKQEGNSLKIKSNLIKNFLDVLPFKLTDAQLHSLTEIKNDMASDEPMNRLLQGDVGSGKTIVALISMLIAADNGYQSILMAPTEILADQHAKNISSLMIKLNEKFPEHKIKVSLLLGGQMKNQKETKQMKMELSEADIIIGTHALFEEKVEFRNPGLIVVDEQHRFGVEQRAKIVAKGKTPDVIVMSATPIPRTLSMTLYGDLDLSIINEMPKGRKPVKTLLRDESKLPDIYKFIIDKSKEGVQSFIVYPLVEESEKLELKAAQKYFDELSTTVFKDIKVGLIHGRMNWKDKEEQMILFQSKKYDVLISTTVIEVGIDIPGANIILINDAHRFGLSQLHQLRGRVGRSSADAFCILVTRQEFVRTGKQQKDIEYLSSSQIEKMKTSIRLNTMVKHTDGFKIAEVDMKLRGPGDIFGKKQTGFPELKQAMLPDDIELLIKAKTSAFSIIESDPRLVHKENKILRQSLLQHHKENLKYARIA